MLIPADDAVVHETPNATMTTLASPSLGSHELVVWRVEMAAGSSGPPHQIHGEQVMVVLDGAVTVQIGDDHLRASVGDTLVLPADTVRQVIAPDGATALVTSTVGVTFSAGEQQRQPLTWAQ